MLTGTSCAYKGAAIERKSSIVFAKIEWFLAGQAIERGEKIFMTKCK